MKAAIVAKTDAAIRIDGSVLVVKRVSTSAMFMDNEKLDADPNKMRWHRFQNSSARRSPRKAMITPMKPKHSKTAERTQIGSEAQSVTVL